MIDEETKRQVGIWVLIVSGAFGVVLLEHIKFIGWSVMWIWFIGITWYASEMFLGFLIYHFFKVSKADIPGKLILTKTESAPKAESTETTAVRADYATSTADPESE